MDITGRYLNALLSQVTTGKASKKELVAMAQNEPARTLVFFMSLPEQKKRSYHWLGDIAEKYLDNGARGVA